MGGNGCSDSAGGILSPYHSPGKYGFLRLGALAAVDVVVVVGVVAHAPCISQLARNFVSDHAIITKIADGKIGCNLF